MGFLGADWWGSDARAMAIEFRKRSHLLIERHYEDYYPTKWNHLALKLARRLLRLIIIRDYNQAVEQLLNIDALDFLLVFKGMLLKANTLAQFKKRRVPSYCFYPDVSFLDHGQNIWECLPLYDGIFTTKPYHLDDSVLRKRVRHIELTRHGFDPDVHRPVFSSLRLTQSYKCDVSFVGCWSHKKEAILGSLLSSIPKLNLHIWGPAWHRANESIRQKWMGRSAYGDELAAIYFLSTINLGLLSEAGSDTAKGDSTTARTWQIPASRGFLLHEDTEEVRRFFEPEKEIALFRSNDELVQKVMKYQKNQAERDRIRNNAYQRALSVPYSYADAVDRILAFHCDNNSDL